MEKIWSYFLGMFHHPINAIPAVIIIILIAAYVRIEYQKRSGRNNG